MDHAALARPYDPADYVVPTLDGSGPKAAQVPKEVTGPDASWNVWPSRILDGCRDPLVALPDTTQIGGPVNEGLVAPIEDARRPDVPRSIGTGDLFRHLGSLRP